MYNKIFTKILDSSIWLAPDPHRLVWITLIAAMDRHGIAQFACIENLAARARVSREDTYAAVVAFESPDPYAPSQEYGGRRIDRIDGGWLVLNAEKYRNIVTAAVAAQKTTERVRKHREAKRVTECNGLKRSVTPSEHINIKSSDSEDRRPLNMASKERFEDLRQRVKGVIKEIPK